MSKKPTKEEIIIMIKEIGKILGGVQMPDEMIDRLAEKVLADYKEIEYDPFRVDFTYNPDYYGNKK